MAEYKWLAEKKQQAMKEKMAVRGMPSYRQLPISERYGVSFTGYGNNGRLDRRAPAQIDESTGQPIMLHEGEVKMNIPEGEFIADANISKMMQLSPEEQATDDLYDSEGNLPGMCSGGFMKRFSQGGFCPSLAGSIRPLAEETAKKFRKSMPEYAGGGFSRTPQDPVAQAFLKTKEAVTHAQVTGQPSPLQPITAQDLLKNKQEITHAQVTGQPAPILAGQQAAQPAVQTAPTAPVSTGAPITVTAPKIQTPATTFAAQQPIQIPTPPPVTQPAPVIQPTPAPTPAATVPQPIQVTPVAAPTVNQPVSQPVTFAPLAGQPAAVPTQEETARTKGLDYILSILTGENSPLTIEGKRLTSELSTRQAQERSALEQKLLQQGADPGRARTEAAMLRDKQEGELNTLAAKYGIDAMKLRQEAAGTAATQGLAGEQFEETKRTTEYNRKTEQAKLLISAGGEGNLTAAAQIYNDMYPGMNIDFSKVLTAEHANDFNTGMDAVARYIASGMSYGEAIVVMRQDGTIGRLGLREDQIEVIYNSIKTNAIDEQWNTIADSAWYRALPVEDQQAMNIFFTDMLLGRTDYSISYDVKDTTGNTLSTFSTQADAQAYATAHPGSNVASRIVPVTEVTSAVPAPGEPGGTIPKEQVPVEHQKQGDYYTLAGKLYKVGTDLTANRVTELPEDPIGKDAKAIIAAGEEGNALYQPALAAIKKAAKEGTITFEDVQGLAPDDPISLAVLSGLPLDDYNSIWGKAGDLKKGKIVKINVKGVEYVARYDGNWSRNDVGRIDLTTTDGKRIEFKSNGAVTILR